MAATRTLGELARLVEGEATGDPALPIHGVAELERAGPGEIAFVARASALPGARASRAGALIVPPDLELPDRPLIRVRDPYLAVARILRVFHPAPTFPPGIHPSAVVAASAGVDPAATVLAYAVVGEESLIGPRAVLFPHVFVGARCEVGEGSVLYPHVVLREAVRVGRGVIVHAGAIIGADGFGYAFDGSRHQKIPQVGRVIIEDDVEIGANVTIDRATLGETVVRRGTKIDNLVQIGHNTVVGADCIIVGQTGISGSCRIGDRAVLGGQVGIADHVEIGEGAQIASQYGVHRDVPAGEAVLGSPALPIALGRRVAASLARLPELLRAVRELERRVAALEARRGGKA
ncbi:MAG: UDP-3-O-(3-hydroxymyristoyl)glucosamine N-acyltransferase [Candidatus Rokubacteria bacterium]|nr:UDP-3-O-(3-hydroxymyristoyl)glucosamine N-acyltransferase [Candidatus Rokubacteria bacterium]